MLDLTEPQKMAQAAIRAWAKERLAPRVESLESGESLPYPLMRDLAETFGIPDVARAAFDTIAAGSESKAQVTRRNRGASVAAATYLWPLAVCGQLLEQFSRPVPRIDEDYPDWDGDSPLREQPLARSSRIGGGMACPDVVAESPSLRGEKGQPNRDQLGGPSSAPRTHAAMGFERARLLLSADPNTRTRD